ncbi:pseudouridine synthase [Nanchangia anserum]|uniref:RNA pseudouridylate synthase n=1 Tax=Nanchangia anserum TaxID=2692125 RepID=A0A8I0G961_9ACTO|nr:hypothetical protein [Nanchangia anserum]
MARAGEAGEVVAEALATLTAHRRTWEVAAAFRRGDVVDAGGKRIDPGDIIAAGQRVFIHSAAPDEPGWPHPLIELWRGDDARIVDKPGGISTAPRGAFVARSVVVAARRQWGIDDVVPAHRLDRLTTGCLLLVTDPRARAHYQRAFAERRVEKTYLALTRRSGLNVGDEATWRPHLLAPKRGGIVAVDPRGVPTYTRARVLAVDGEHALWQLRPEGGRRHQLRVTLAHAGYPILGDPLYGPIPDPASDRLALHAASLTCDGPAGRISAAAPVPRWWPLRACTQ